MSEAQQRLDAHADEITAAGADLAEEVIPPVAAAVAQQVQDDYPRYLRALERQGNQYLENVEELMMEKVRNRYGDYVRTHRDVFKEEFPKHASNENVKRVLSDFQEVANRLIERYYVGEFRAESQRTVAIWNQFAPVDLPGPNDPTLEEQLADYISDWTVLAAADQVETSSASKGTIMESSN